MAEIAKASRKVGFTLFPFAVLIALSGCGKAYYKAWEALGKEKRDLLVSEMGKTNSDQQELQNQFKDTLQRIRTEYKFDEGNLGKTYDNLSRDYDRAEAKAKSLRSHIARAKTIASDLFVEWRTEANQMTDADLRNQSLRELEESQARFATTAKLLDESVKRIDPVLKSLHDHVLAIKHALNAKAIGGLEGNLRGFLPQIEQLITNMQQSIDSAREYEKSLKK